VRFAGVDVGQVKDIRLALVPEEQVTKVHLYVWLRKDVSVPADSSILINTLGFLGEKYVEIIPGKDYSHPVPADSSINGIDPIPIHNVVQLVNKIATDVDEGIERIKNKEGNLGKLIYDDTLYRELESAIKNKEGTIGKLLYDNSLYNELEAAVRNKQGTIGKLFYDDAVYNELKDFIADIKLHPWKLFWKGKEKKR
jgi:phospholipid/cholesterol/gamma-HCH transport system substrate-binding protein